MINDPIRHQERQVYKMGFKKTPEGSWRGLHYGEECFSLGAKAIQE